MAALLLGGFRAAGKAGWCRPGCGGEGTGKPPARIWEPFEGFRCGTHWQRALRRVAPLDGAGVCGSWALCSGRAAWGTGDTAAGAWGAT